MSSVDPNADYSKALTAVQSSKYVGAGKNAGDLDHINNLTLDGLCLYLTAVDNKTLAKLGPDILKAIDTAYNEEEIHFSSTEDYEGIKEIAKSFINDAELAQENDTTQEKTDIDEERKLDVLIKKLENDENIENQSNNEVEKSRNAQEMRKHCTKCGEEIEEDWDFCNNCGNKLK